MKEVFEGLKLYIQEILTIILPGSFLLCVLCSVELVSKLLQSVMMEMPNSTNWLPVLVFVATAYFVGHLLYVGARFIDDLLFGRIPINWRSHDELVKRLKCLKESHTGIADQKAYSAFKYALALLKLQHPDAYTEVMKTVAESKFFRSMVVASLLSALLMAFPQRNEIDTLRLELFGLFILLGAVSVFPYLYLRKRYVELACQYVLASQKQAIVPPSD